MDSRLRKKAKIQDVPIAKMRVREEIAQRKFNPAWASKIAQDFQIDKLGLPIVNHVGDWYWIIDGQHRVSAVKQWLGDWEGQTLECLVYQGLSEKEEAEGFLGLNAVKQVRAFDKFRIALTAGRTDETNVEAIVRKNKLKVSEKPGEDTVSCVSTLLRVYRRGADCLDRDLRIVSDSFGDTGLDSDVIDGIGLLVSRYNGRLEDARAIRCLSTMRGGVNALRSRAERLRQQTGAQRSHCIAAAAVEVINRGKGGKKLPAWWKTEE